MSNWFTSNESLIQSALVFALLAYSFQVALRAGVFSLAGVGFFAIGGYTSAILSSKHGWPSVLAILAALVLSGVIGLGLALVLARLRSLYLAMATVAFNLLVQVVANEWDGQTGGALGLFGVPVAVTTLGLVATVIVVSLVLWGRERGSSRRTLEALRLDEQLAPVLGIDVVRRRHQAFVLSAVLGALSGAMNTLLFTTISPAQVGFGLIVTALTMIVIGGISSWVGALVGAFIVTWLPDWLAFSGDWRPIIEGAITVFMVVWVSDGLVGLLGRGRRYLMARAPSLRRSAVPAEAGP
jgi:branched-chain amino acid transport system permease protein